jgi:hypothetical protein
MSEPPQWGADSHLRLELAHLSDGATADSAHVGLGPFAFRFAAPHPGEVLGRAKAVLSVAITAMLEGWDPAEDVVPAGIPVWFSEACAPEDTATEDRWSLMAWLRWCDPDERQWFWWDARVVAPGVGEVLVETTGAPFPSGALRWLLTAAGGCTK